MSNPIIGKWEESSEQGLSEFYQAIGLPDPAPDSTASFEYQVDEDGNYTEIFDTGASTTTRDFTSGVENNGTTTVVDGNVINETENLENGNIMNVRREFGETQMVTTLTSPNVGELKAVITFQKL